MEREIGMKQIALLISCVACLFSGCIKADILNISSSEPVSSSQVELQRSQAQEEVVSETSEAETERPRQFEVIEYEEGTQIPKRVEIADISQGSAFGNGCIILVDTETKPNYTIVVRVADGTVMSFFEGGDSVGISSREENGLFLVILNNVHGQPQLFGWINEDGECVIEPIYSAMSDWDENNIAVVQVAETRKMGMIDTTGNYIFPPEYTYICDCAEGLYSVKMDGKWGFINVKGEVVIPLIYDKAFPFREGLAVVKTNDKYGYINQQGIFVIAPTYDFSDGFSDGYAVVYPHYEAYEEGADTFAVFSYQIIDQAGTVIYSSDKVYHMKADMFTVSLRKSKDSYLVFDVSSVSPHIFIHEGKEFVEFTPEFPGTRSIDAPKHEDLLVYTVDDTIPRTEVLME